MEYGTEGNGAALDSDDEGIVIPRSSLQLIHAQLHELHETVNHLSECNNYGISLYMQTVQLMRDWTLNN